MCSRFHGGMIAEQHEIQTGVVGGIRDIRNGASAIAVCRVHMHRAAIIVIIGIARRVLRNSNLYLRLRLLVLARRGDLYPFANRCEQAFTSQY